jgi:hypothetical protein
MTKKKINILIPILIIGAFLTYSWIKFVGTDLIATWRHYSALLLFILLLVLFVKRLSAAILGTGIFLILSFFTLIVITPAITTNYIKLASISSPGFHLLSLGIFVLYFILNLDALIEMQLDYNESKDLKRRVSAQVADNTGLPKAPYP